jgi:zinc-ribbon domain
MSRRFRETWGFSRRYLPRPDVHPFACDTYYAAARMEQPCHKCGQSVEEGTPFCPHCGAPQIRVMIAEAALSPAAATVGSATIPAAQVFPSIAVPVSWSSSIQPCVLAALIASVVMVLKLVVPLIAVFGAGFLAVSLYRRRAPEAAIHARSGARLGAICGFFCFGITTVMESVAAILLHKGDEIRRIILEGVQQAAVRYPDPQMQPTLDFLRSPAGLVFMLVFLLFFAFLVALILGSLGGALGGAALGRRDKS